MSLLQHDIALDGCEILVFGFLRAEVVVGGARAQNLEDDDGIVRDRGIERNRRANNKGVGVADAVCGLNLQLASNRLAGLAVETIAQAPEQTRLYPRMRVGSASPRYRPEAVELIAQFLTLLPGEERLQGHRLGESVGHIVDLQR